MSIPLATSGQWRQPDSHRALKWGYGHLVIFGSAAAVGAGIQVAVLVHRGQAHVATTTAVYAVAVPVAVYLLGVGALQIFPRGDWRMTAAVLVAVIAVLVSPLLIPSIVITAMCMVVLVTVTAVINHTVAKALA